MYFSFFHHIWHNQELISLIHGVRKGGAFGVVVYHEPFFLLLKLNTFASKGMSLSDETLLYVLVDGCFDG